MWLLARILPLLVGDFVDEDDKHWQLYLQLMDIVDLIFCPKTSHDHASYVASLISDHHSVFCELYSGKTIIPKMHFMVHMPKLMIKYVSFTLCFLCTFVNHFSGMVHWYATGP